MYVASLLDKTTFFVYGHYVNEQCFLFFLREKTATKECKISDTVVMIRDKRHTNKNSLIVPWSDLLSPLDWFRANSHNSTVIGVTIPINKLIENSYPKSVERIARGITSVLLSKMRMLPIAVAYLYNDVFLVDEEDETPTDVKFPTVTVIAGRKVKGPAENNELIEIRNDIAFLNRTSTAVNTINREIKIVLRELL